MTAEQSTLLIQQQLTQVTQLKALLLSEKEILQQQNIDALTEITNEKNTLLRAIEQLDLQIKNTTDINALTDDESNVLALQEIENIIVECKAANQVNGAVIIQSNLAIDRMKNSLLENRSRTTMTYNSKGKKSGGLSSKSIKA